MEVATLRAIVAARAGRPDLAVESARILARLNEACLHDPFLIGLLVGATGTGMLHSAVWEICHTLAGTAADFARLESTLGALDFHAASLLAWRSEMAGMVETMQYLKSDRRQVAMLFGMSGPVSGDSNYVIDLLTRALPIGFIDANTAVLADREFRYVIQPHRLPGWQPALKAGEDWEKEMIALKKRAWLHPSTIGVAVVFPPSRSVLARAVYADNLIQQAIIACALERFRLDQGSYPSTLEAVRLASGNPLPLDPISLQPMHYRPDPDGGYTLWSVGFDGRDDGGQRQVDGSSSGATRFHDSAFLGDWIWHLPPR